MSVNEIDAINEKLWSQYPKNKGALVTRPNSWKTLTKGEKLNTLRVFYAHKQLLGQYFLRISIQRPMYPQSPKSKRIGLHPVSNRSRQHHPCGIAFAGMKDTIFKESGRLVTWFQRAAEARQCGSLGPCKEALIDKGLKL